jgi:hypothetical protein
MQVIPVFFANILYLDAVSDDGVPTTLVAGRPANVPLPVYLKAAQNQARPGFTCNRCRAEVASIVFRGVNSQLCKCMVVQHPGGGVYEDSEAWRSFRDIWLKGQIYYRAATSNGQS